MVDVMEIDIDRPEKVAYFAIPMVGGMFIDFFNAVLISANISWWA